jgi:hypothetical protein
MDHIRRISLLMILAGLLFSPAEGVCLLPYSGSTTITENDISLTIGQCDYQVAIKHFGVKSLAESANKSKNTHVCASAVSQLNLKYDLAGPTENPSTRPVFYCAEHICEFRSRPPPMFE